MRKFLVKKLKRTTVMVGMDHLDPNLRIPWEEMLLEEIERIPSAKASLNAGLAEIIEN